jgi:hypothetical protein
MEAGRASYAPIMIFHVLSHELTKSRIGWIAQYSRNILGEIHQALCAVMP